MAVESPAPISMESFFKPTEISGTEVSQVPSSLEQPSLPTEGVIVSFEEFFHGQTPTSGIEDEGLQIDQSFFKAEISDNGTEHIVLNQEAIASAEQSVDAYYQNFEMQYQAAGAAYAAQQEQKKREDSFVSVDNFSVKSIARRFNVDADVVKQVFSEVRASNPFASDSEVAAQVEMIVRDIASQKSQAIAA